jgi:hypothetical protein
MIKIYIVKLVIFVTASLPLIAFFLNSLSYKYIHDLTENVYEQMNEFPATVTLTILTCPVTSCNFIFYRRNCGCRVLLRVDAYYQATRCHVTE